MHILITRPECDAADLKTRIEAFGCRVSLAPLLEIQFHSIDAGALSGASAIVATSRNGLRALAHSDALAAALSLPIFTVGPATAKLAQDVGFSRVVTGAGTAADLVPAIKNHPASHSGRLVHLAGDHLAFDLETALASEGITLAALPAYSSVAAETLPVPIVDMLMTKAFDAVVLMSPRSAVTWARIIALLPVRPPLATTMHVCLSQAVADGLGSLPRVPKLIADRPNADAIVSAVYRLAGSGKTG
jgi:uroporphyrinogen-III synthase